MNIQNSTSKIQRPPGQDRLVTRLSVLALLTITAAVSCWQSNRLLEASQNSAPPKSTVHMAFLGQQQGRLHRLGHKRSYNGWMIERYPDGTLKSRSRVVDGRLDGISEGLHPNGKLQVREHFRRGISDGLRTKWYPNGNKLSETTVVGGKINGFFRRWHENGALAEESSIQAGRPEGLSRAYYPSGFLKTQVRLDAGKVVEKEFWKDGELRLTAAVGSGDR